MYGLVITDDLVVLVMFWELTSVLSYLLIGFYNRRGASRRAACRPSSSRRSAVWSC